MKVTFKNSLNNCEFANHAFASHHLFIGLNLGQGLFTNGNLHVKSEARPSSEREIMC